MIQSLIPEGKAELQEDNTHPHLPKPAGQQDAAQSFLYFIEEKPYEQLLAEITQAPNNKFKYLFLKESIWDSFHWRGGSR